MEKEKRRKKSSNKNSTNWKTIHFNDLDEPGKYPQLCSGILKVTRKRIKKERKRKREENPEQEREGESDLKDN